MVRAPDRLFAYAANAHHPRCARRSPLRCAHGNDCQADQAAGPHRGQRVGLVLGSVPSTRVPPGAVQARRVVTRAGRRRVGLRLAGRAAPRRLAAGSRPAGPSGHRGPMRRESSWCRRRGSGPRQHRLPAARCWRKDHGFGVRGLEPLPAHHRVDVARRAIRAPGPVFGGDRTCRWRRQRGRRWWRVSGRRLLPGLRLAGRAGSPG